MYVLDPGSHTLPDKLMALKSVNLFVQFSLLQKEIKKYNSALLDKHQMIVVNKMDIKGAEDCIRNLYSLTNMLIIPVSGLHRLNTDCLSDIMLCLHLK